MENDDIDFDVLPAVHYKDEIMSAIRTNQTIICIGETGSGKTTQIPQVGLLELAWAILNAVVKPFGNNSSLVRRGFPWLYERRENGRHNSTQVTFSDDVISNLYN